MNLSDWSRILGPLENGLQGLSPLLGILLVARIRSQGLHRVYPCLFGYLIFDVLRTAAGMVIPYRTTAYALVFKVTEPLALVAYFLLIYELYHHVLEAHPGLDTAGRYMLYAGLGAAVLVTAGSATWSPGGPERYAAIRLIMRFSASLITAVMVFLVAITAFLAWFPVSIRKNTLACLVAYGCFFAGKALLLVTRAWLGEGWRAMGSTTNLLLANLWLVYLVARLSAGGERESTTVRRPAGDAEELLAQLRQINRTLDRGAKEIHGPLD